MANVGTYSPKKVEVLVNGVPLRGFADGTFVVAERTSDTFATNVGADGEVSRTHNADATGKVTVTLQQTSDSNDLLSVLVNLDERTLKGQFVFMLKDTNGTTLLVSQCAWLDKQANAEFSNELTNREWVISCSELVGVIGGNS